MAHLLSLTQDRPGAIVDIGCGQGTFLRTITRRLKRRGFGVDPSFDGPNDIVDMRVQRRFFDAEIAASLGRERIALVCIRHVLEHISDPGEMLDHVAIAIRRSPGAVVYVEVPCFGWIASHAAFYDLFHEHCSLFTAGSLRSALSRKGFVCDRIEHGFGDQYLGAVARLGGVTEIGARDSIDHEDFEIVGNRLRQAKMLTGQRLADCMARGPIVFWGAGAKGISALNHLNLHFGCMPEVVDVHPGKQGRFVPVTAQCVVAPRALAQSGVDTADRLAVVTMNPNYRSEIAAELLVQGVHAHLISLEDLISDAIPCG